MNDVYNFLINNERTAVVKLFPLMVKRNFRYVFP